MDGPRFDRLTRTFATSRRNAIKLALGGALAGLSSTPDHGSAARRGFPGPPNPFEPPTCSIGGATYSANTIEPGNPCHICDPGLDRTDWSPNAGAFCGDGTQVCCNGSCCAVTECCSLDETCTPCRCDIEGALVTDGTLETPQGCLVCDPAQSTSAWSPMTDRSTCGGVAGRVCCNGECCSPTECCTGISCEECGPHCLIAGIEIPAETPNPQNECEVCDPARAIDAWSDATDGIACNQGDGCCTAGVCGGCSCIIDGDPVPDRTDNPRNDCQECIYARDPDDWSNRANGSSCGNANDRDCCDGECCPAGSCCTLDGCEPCCHIGSDTVADGVVNPRNTCQVCDSSRNSSDWTTLGNGDECGATGNSECCNGECCPTGQCCQNGACGRCDCVIGGIRFDPDEINRANSCEICKPELNRFAWSPVASGTSCGSNGETCCGGTCCSTDLCCLLDACGECLCSIENEIVDPEQRNPQNTCQFCDPHADPFDWSTVPDRGSCGQSGDQQCCNGFCCDPGQCCLGGACRPCGCFIDGQEVGPNDLNPLNECQICFPDQSTDSWSFLADGGLCGDTGAQCCAAGVCQNCGCLIDGFPHTDGEPNPANECQQCDAALDPSGWSNRGETFFCGDAGDGVCCEGVCCPAGLQCSLEGICGPPGCFIDGAEIRPGEPNSANGCQFCDPDTATDAWSSVADGELCGETPAECCQAGACIICGCLIGVDGFIDGEPNPDNECQQCDHALDQGNWSPRNETFACGPGGDQICCNGVCCPTGNCCNLDDICEPCRCEIEGMTVEAQTFAPDDHCLLCDPASSTTAWTFGPDYSVCIDPTAEVNRFCCQGICCEEHECCRSDGTCGPCTCVIEGAGEFDEGDRNPANDCQICNPTVDRNGWQTLPDGDICGPNLDQTCCSGQCGCPTGCFIDGVNYEDGTVRPRERCDICDAANDPTDWTPRAIPDCPPPCLIAGVIMRYGTVNPDNPCQICRGGVDWSPSSELFCGDGTQVCCNGACCDAGACCSAEGICGFDNCEQQGCVIDGMQFEDGAENPTNACQVCDISQSTSAWTPQFGQCGPNFDQFCCDGVCCDLGACCNSDQVCDFDTCQTCAIDGVLYFPEDLNPANSCEWCISNTNKFAWTVKPDNFFCDEMQLTVCCNGSCCNPGESCSGGGCQPN